MTHLESVMLELVSHSDDVEIVSPDSLKLKIENNDPRPFVSFSSTIGTQRLLGEYATTDIPGSSVPEGEQGDFRVVLDRKSNRDVEFFIGFSGRPHLFSNDNEELVLPSSYIWTHGYLTEQGYRPGNPLNEWSLLRIPAGELGTTFTVDTRSAENDLYDYYWDRTISFGHIYVDKDHYAYTDHIGAKHNFFIAQDEPAPKLLLKSSAADDDGDATVTVSEGESFDVWVEVSHQFGTSVLFNEPDMNLKARLIATAITGAIPNLDLPDVYIGAYQSGVTVTMRIPVGSFANGEGTVALGFGDVVQLRRGTGNLFEVSARVGNRLIVNVQGGDSTVAALSTSMLTLTEGQAATITVDFGGDLSSLIDGDTTLLTIEARPVEGVETGLIHGTSDIYLPAEQNDYELTPVTIDKQAGQATFEIRAVEDSDYDPLESVMLELVSHSDDIEVGSPNSLKLKIGDNDPRPFVSFSSTIGNQRLNWEYENVGVQVSSVLEGDKRDYRIVLDRKSNRDTEFVVYLGGGDTPLLLREDGETPFPHSTYWSGPKYQDGEGYWSWSVREEWERVIIPAGELGLTFTVDTTSLENDLYDYYWDRALAVMFIYVYKDHYAYTDEIGSKHYFFITQDEPAPQLLLKNSANDGDGDASITVSEGESFDVWVDISHQLGTLVIFDEPGLNLKARLTATTVSGAELNLDLPDVLIGAYQSGVTVTMRIPVGSFANGEGTVVLGFRDVVQLRRGPGVAFGKGISARVGNRLIVTIVDDDEPPIVKVKPGTSTSLTSTSSVRRSDLSSVDEGDTVQLVAELTNAPEGGATEDITVNLATGNGATASESDYSYPSSVTIPQGQSRVTFEVSALQDDLVEDDETLNIYASSVDFNSQNYEQSDAGVDLTIVDVDFNDPPIVSVRRHGANFGVGEGTSASLIAELIPAPQYGTDRDITVHLAIGSWSTASESDYSYPSSVTIPRGQSFVRFDVRALDDNLPEYPETLNVHVSSVDYAGRNYVQSRGGVDLRIISDDRIEPVITVLGGVDHLEGSTVAVRIAVSQVLPANIPVNAVTLSVLLSDSVRSVSVDGRPLVSGRPPVLYIVNALKASTEAYVVFSLTDDYIASPDGFVKLRIDSYDSLLLSGAQSSFRIVDNDEPPVVSIRSLRRAEPAEVSVAEGGVEVPDLSRVSEGDTVQLVAELTNAPEGGAPEDITVFLAARAGGTAKPEDIDFPASVTIAAGDSSVRFPVSATEDSLVEYDEKINIYAASVEYGDSSLTLSDSGYDLTITSADRITARIAVLPSSDLVEGGVATLRIALSSPLPARVPAESLYLVLGDDYADIDITEELRSSPVLDLDIQLQDDSQVGSNTPLTAELRFDSEEIPFLDGANVSFEVADNDEQPVVVVPVTPPPIVVEPDTESPTVVIPVTPPPIVVEPDTESPTVVVPVTPPPIVVEPGTESPTVVIPVTPPSIVVEPGTESPTVVIPVTPPSIVVEPDTESPTVVIPVTPPSIVVEPGTESPTVVVPVTPPPIVVEPDTKPPAVVTPPPTVVPPDTGDKDRIEAAIEVLGTSNLTEGGVANLRIILSKVLPKSIPADALQLVLNGDTYLNDLSGLPVDLTKLLQDGASTEVAVRILDDNLLEADEKVSVRLDFKANQIPSLSGAEVSFTIADNDSGEIIVDASDDTITEGQSSFLTLRLSNDLIAGSDIQIDYEFEFVDGGSHLAASSSDLTGESRGSITLPTGSNSVRLELEPADDTIVEETEFLRFRLTRAAVDAGTDVSIDNAHTDLLILDNDAASLPPLPRVIYVEADAAHGEVGERISVDGYFEFDQESAELFETSFNWLIVDGNGLFVEEPAELEIALVGEAVEVEGKSRMDVAVELILNAVIPAEGAADELRYLVLAIDQRASDGTRLDVVEYRAPLTVELARPRVVLISPDADNSHCEDDENACIQVPRGAAPEELQVEVVKLDGEEVAKELPQGYNYVPQVPVWDITFRDSEGQERDSLERGVQICLSADMAELDSVGGHEMVQIATFHEAHGDWLLLDTTYDAEQDRFCGYSRLFSDFALVYVMADTEVLPQLELPSTGGLSLPVWLVLLLALVGVALLAPALRRM